jgi:hypothetical protein
MSLPFALNALYGAEGEGWDYADGTIAAMGAEKTLWKAYAAEARALPKGFPVWMSPQYSAAKQAAAGADGTVELQSYENWQGYLNKVSREIYEPAVLKAIVKPMPKLVISDELLAELDSVSPSLRREHYTYILDSSRAMVTGDTDIETEYPKYLAKLQEMGLQKLLDVMQRAYDSQLGG